MSLILHCGANAVSRESLASTATPAATATHHPIAHNTLLDRVCSLIENSGWNVASEAHALSHNGNRYFGLLELQSANDHGLVIGIRNSHDKTFPAALALGSKIFVCDNLSFSGDVKIARKHTRFIVRDLPRVVASAFHGLTDYRRLQDRRFDAYRNRELSTVEAHDLIVKAIDVQAVVASDVPAVLKQWRSPNHPEFRERTAWSLFNAFTDVYKAGSLIQTHKKSQRLHGLLDAHIGLTS